jgi:site-specific recombinase XerD
MADYVITVYHDLRRAKGKQDKDKPLKEDKQVYPVKIRVYYDYKTRFYPIGIDLTEDRFNRSFLAEKPRGEFADIKDEITLSLTRAKETAKHIKPFDWHKFEKKLLRPTSSNKDVFYHYNQVIESLTKEDRIKTASNYHLSQKSIKGFLESKKRSTTALGFDLINIKFLNDYEAWMLKQDNSLTTVGIYLRPLRALFNAAIDAGEIGEDIYPFGKKKYEIPTGENVKKALTKEDLKNLFFYPVNPESPIIKARDFWFFSYQANGMNIRDICDLKYGNINKDRIAFIRAKTRRTTKRKQKIIVVVITPFIQQVIDQYGNKNAGPNTYVFPVLNNSMNATEKVSSTEAFTKYINQHMKKLAKQAGVDEDISTYFARHSFTTISVQNGATLEFIQEALGHQNLTTTQNYFAGFDESKKIENANKLMDFE